MTAQPSIVWILGAGFSKGLGGPLITDLLAHRELTMLKSIFPEEAHGDAATEIFKARLFFNYGKEHHFWDHAEQFLDVVESADAENGQERSQAHALLSWMLKDRVRYPLTETKKGGASLFGGPPAPQVPGPSYDFDSIGKLASACRRALAVDCSLFLKAAQVETERWVPYRHWASELDGSHTVITFNYDQVPELLAQSANLTVVDPNHSVQEMSKARELNVAPVIKLHGSVTWRLEGKNIEVMPLGDKRVGDPSVDVAIGVPGPKKRDLYQRTLSEFRQAAIEVIQSAQRINLIGFRFPPTDADARRDILEAIAKNRHGNALKIETVLGPNVNGDDSTRLRRLIETVTRGRPHNVSVDQVPLFAEDYLLRVGPTS
jgi:hypothetical protein